MQLLACCLLQVLTLDLIHAPRDLLRMLRTELLKQQLLACPAQFRDVVPAMRPSCRKLGAQFRLPLGEGPVKGFLLDRGEVRPLWSKRATGWPVRRTRGVMVDFSGRHGGDQLHCLKDLRSRSPVQIATDFHQSLFFFYELASTGVSDLDDIHASVLRYDHIGDCLAAQPRRGENACGPRAFLFRFWHLGHSPLMSREKTCHNAKQECTRSTSILA